MISEILRNPHGPAAGRMGEESGEIITSIIVLAELRFGLAKSPSARRSKLVDRLLESLPVVDWAPPAETRYGEIRAELERRGMPIGGNDLFIAAHALALDATLVTANEREFGRVPGLRIENWIV